MHSDPVPEPAFGVYGIGLDCTDVTEPLLTVTDGRWLAVHLEQRTGRGRYAHNSFGPDQAHFSLMDSGSLLLHRERRSAVFTAPAPLPAQALVHPYLGPVGATFALWAGREALHAGGFAGRNGAWGLLGDRQSGKSSTLASLLTAGVVDILCDDVLITDGSTAFAGPRCIDLRRPAALRLAMGELVPLPGERERWRVPLRAVPPELPMRGWVCLEWGPNVSISPVPVRERLTKLAANRSMLVVPPRPATLLELAALPAWTLTRPNDWAAMPEVLDRLLVLAES